MRFTWSGNPEITWRRKEWDLHDQVILKLHEDVRNEIYMIMVIAGSFRIRLVIERGGK